MINIFDDNEVRGGGHSVFFDGLPFFYRLLIRYYQEKIDRDVKFLNPGLVSTSGFRSPFVNSLVGGVVGSKHIYGLARDFRKTDYVPCLPNGYRLVDSGVCWHFEMVV